MRQEPDPAGDLLGPGLEQVLPIEQDPSLAGGDHPGQRREQRGLAAGVGADDHRERVLGQFQVEVGGHDPAFVAALAAAELPTGFAWVAGESGMVTAVRRHLLARGQELDRVQFTGYWRLGGPL